MLAHPPLLKRIQWMMGPGFVRNHPQQPTLSRGLMCGVGWQEAHAQPRCVMSTKGTQGHLLHGMIEGPEGLIETGTCAPSSDLASRGHGSTNGCVKPRHSSNGPSRKLSAPINK